MLVADILDRAAASFGEALPRLAGAVVLLVAGLLLADRGAHRPGCTRLGRDRPAR